MPRFKQRIEIDAWQFTNTPSDNNPPDWIIEARKKWPHVGGIKTMGPDDPKGVGIACVQVAERERNQTAYVGDWIVRPYGCGLHTCSAEHFEFQYEPVAQEGKT